LGSIRAAGERVGRIERISPHALERLVTAVLSEMHDEWIVFPRRYLSEASMTAIYADEHADHTTRALPNTPNATDD
jgi:putative transposase